MGRQVQRYGDLARQLGKWVGINEEVAPHRTGSSALRTQDFGYMDNESFCVVVFPFITVQVSAAVGKSFVASQDFHTTLCREEPDPAISNKLSLSKTTSKALEQ